MLSRREVEQAIRSLLGKYHADYAILFGSYELTCKDVDAFELREINRESDFYRTVMREGVRIA